ncbi:MAG TPA: CoA pyrophosphatase [Dehalococcoidales bacterium]|nr:CoA pyrophosphatase [Dehalococcoidales bacterium]
MSGTSDLLNCLRMLLAGLEKQTVQDKARRASAVLIPVFFQEDRLHMLFTKRTELVHHHKGEISFPGGGFHAGDGSLLQTALREAHEEIGLDPAGVQVLGELDQIVTRGSPYIISPFIGLIPPAYQYKTSAFEIAEIIIIPVQALIIEGCREDGIEVMPEGHLVASHVYAYQKYRITGATARILRQFLDLYLRADCSVCQDANPRLQEGKS